MEAGNRGSIVVGFDGSESSEHALEWAVAEARLRDARLDLVSAWDIANLVYAYGYVPAMSPPLESEAQAHAEELLAETKARLADSGVAISTEAVRGQAADVLVAAAEKADLLVLGSRGHGGFTGLLLGSVGAQCAHHAHCPVVIVR